MLEVEQQTHIMIPIDKIVKKLSVRRISESGKKRILESMKKVGFLDNYPLIVLALANKTYLLIDGNHRLEVAKTLDIALVPCVIKTKLTELEQYKLALESNEAAETIVPSTLITYAEFIWARSDEGKTQEEIADTLKWKREKVAKYAMLRNICPTAWSVIVPTFESLGTSEEDEIGTKNVPTGTFFTEGLLRSILDLTPEQQIELVTELIINKDFSKGKFKTLAENYQARNEMYDYTKRHLGDIGEYYISQMEKEVRSGAYDEEWKKSQDTKKREYGIHPKLDKLIKAIHDEWEQKNSIHLIHGDYYEEILKIGTGSVDLILVDPPYNIANTRIFNLDGRSNRSQNFGTWDKYHRADFIALFPIWAGEWERILQPNGSGFVFVSYLYASYLAAALEETGLHVKEMIDWCKTNPGPQIEHTTFRSAVEHILYFTKGKGGHTFHWLGENEMLTHFRSSICQGKERLVDKKNEILHSTQKPENVISHLMSIGSNRGDMVFDGFAGVMTTAKVAKDLGRKCICIEQDETFFEAGRRRVED